jgi:hypothetical protein
MLEFFTIKNIQTIIDGALGGLTFGIYHGIVTQRQLEEFNKKIELERKEFYKKYEQQRKENMKMLLEAKDNSCFKKFKNE